jgi:O-antigen/teichoic acid export membrane protein
LRLPERMGMIRYIFNTTLVKGVNAFVTFLILLINARMLGPENLGTIGLLLLAVTVILMMNNLVGGSALIFLTPRYSLKRIVLLSYLWCLVSVTLGGFVITLFRIEPVQYSSHIIALSALLGLGYVNQNILLGRERIIQMNLIALVQYITLIAAVVYIFYVRGRPGITGYLTALYVSGGVQLLLGWVLVFRLIQVHPVSATKGLVPALVRYGFYVQVAMLAQFFNYRLSYYFIEAWLGRARLGLFEIGSKLSDGLWLFPKSVALVQYSVIANADAERDVATLTLRLLRFTTLVAFAVVLVMVMLPEAFYLFLFGEEYAGLRTVIRYLAPGMVSMSASMILAHHFAGLGKHYINTIGSTIGLACIALTCYLLIPPFGLPGAAMAASVTYTVTLIYHLLVFHRREKTRLPDYLFGREDIQFVKQILLSLRRGKQGNN